VPFTFPDDGPKTLVDVTAMVAWICAPLLKVLKAHQMPELGFQDPKGCEFHPNGKA